MLDYRDRLRVARLDAGLSLSVLADLTGLSTSTISAVELHNRHLTAPKLFAWAHACGASLDDLADSPDTGRAHDLTEVALDLWRNDEQKTSV